MASLAATASRPAKRGPGFSLRWLGDALAHGYVWAWLAVFALPFVATLAYSLRTPEGEWTIAAYQYVFGSFTDNLLLSVQTTVITIVLNLVISIPAAYAIVRHPIPGKSFVLSTLNLSLYTPAEMTEAIDFAIEGIHPNVLQYTTDSATMQQLLRGGVVDAVGFWNSLARMEFLNGQANTAFMIALSGQFLANGYMWIPKGTPHPVLAQIFVDWRLSDAAQFPPESWGLEPGPWAELNEGILGESYEALIPEWFAEDYFTYYPTIEQLSDSYRSVDWEYYAEHVGEWMDYYAQGIGQ